MKEASSTVWLTGAGFGPLRVSHTVPAMPEVWRARKVSLPVLYGEDAGRLIGRAPGSIPIHDPNGRLSVLLHKA